LLTPLRPFFINGNSYWTGEGKLYSWHMMSGASTLSVETFVVVAVPPNEEKEHSYPLRFDKYLNKEQIRTIGKFPIVAPQFAKFVKKEMEIDGFTKVKVFFNVFSSKNGKPLKPLIDPNADLSVIQTKFWAHNDWILLYLDEGN
jgi:hypothetical protein